MNRVVATIAAFLALSAFFACSDNPVGNDGDPVLTFSADSVSVIVGGPVPVAVTLSNTSEKAQYVSRDERQTWWSEKLGLDPNQ